MVTSSHLGNEASPSKPSRIRYSFSVLGDLDAEISPENEASLITDLASFRAVGVSNERVDMTILSVKSASVTSL
ncbi:hypothetical protein IHE45_16G013200 [Dioscorea alata]|uniref:Uncharacterized protein n=1 Tax=Dioscorea alata TaxID=55571 RepID=A0ACB7UFT6_DIOAL|nr:hypothetical protein IHE45_16G013200 [Dioscorea alata]